MIAPDKLPPAREDYRYCLALYLCFSRLRAMAQCYRDGYARGNGFDMAFHLRGLRDEAYAMRSLRTSFNDWRVPEPAHAD